MQLSSNARKAVAIGLTASTLLWSAMLSAPLIASAAVHSDGCIVIDSTGTAWYLSGGTKRGFPSAEVFQSYGYNFGQLAAASAEDVALPQGAIMVYADGTLVKGPGDPLVYLVTGGQKRGFTSGAVFSGAGYSFSNIQSAPFNTFADLPPGANLNDTVSAHPTGVTVLNNGTVWLMSSTSRMGYPSMAIFSSRGMTLAKVVAANGADMALPEGPVVVMLTGCTGGTPPPPSSGPVSVSLSSDNPAGSTIVTGQATADLLHFTLTGNGTVATIMLHRTGISDQSTLSNVYLYDGITRLTDGYSFNSTGDITMSSLNLAVSGSRTISVKADVATGATAGATIMVGVSSLTVTGGTPVPATVNGNTFTVASGAGVLATASFGANTVTGTPTINAGTTGYTFWSAPLQVNTRAVWLKSAAFRMVGSAPSDALSNIKLFVDGVDSGVNGTVIVIQGSNYAMFNASANPVSLATGSHTIDVRADVQKGSSRTIAFSLQQAADLMIFDPQVGVNIAVTGTIPNNAATITIGTGSVTVVLDPAFQSVTNVTGGASNVAIAKFKLHAYGEDVKVQSLAVTPSFVTAGTVPAPSGLQNVTLYFNGSQVGAQQSPTGAGTVVGTNTTYPLTYTLGSQMIIPAGTDSTLEVRVDLRNSAGANYTAGQIFATLVAGTTNGQGQSSFNTFAVPTTNVTGNTLTIATGLLGVSVNSAFTSQAGNPNTAGLKIGSFTVQNQSSSESVRVTTLNVGLATAASTFASTTSGNLTAISQAVNLTAAAAATAAGQVATTGFSVGNVISIPAATSAAIGTVTAINSPTQLQVNVTTAGVGAGTVGGLITGSGATNGPAALTNFAGLRTSETSGSGATPIQPQSTNTFSVNFTLAPGATKNIDILADSSTANMGAITSTLTVTSIGVSSNVSTSVGPVTGQTISFSSGTFNAPTFVSSTSMPAQFIAGGTTAGTTDASSSTFNFTATNGTATISELKFAVSGIGATSVKVAGVSAPVSNGVAYLTGLNIAVPNASGGVDVPALVSYSPVGSTGVASSSLSELAVKYAKFTINGTSSTLTSVENTGATYASGGTFTTVGASSGAIALTGSTTGYTVGDVLFVGTPGTAGVPSGVITAIVVNTSVTILVQSTGTVTGTPVMYEYATHGPTMNLVASKPNLTVATTNNPGLALGEMHLFDVTITPDAKANLQLNQVSFTVNSSGLTAGTLASPRIAVGSTTINLSSCTPAGATSITAPLLVVCTLPSGYNIAAGVPLTISLYGTVAATTVATTSSVTTSLAPADNFWWTDIAGNGTVIKTANLTYLYNYPTQTWSVHN